MKKYTNLKDDELIFFIKLDDQDAVNELIKRYTKEAEIIAKTTLTNYQNTGVTVEELKLVALNAILVAVEYYDFGKSLFKTFWNMIAQREVIDYLRENSYKAKAKGFAGISLDNEIEMSEDRVSISDSIGHEESFEDENFLLDEMIKVVSKDKEFFTIEMHKSIFIAFLKGADREEIMISFKISRSTYQKVIKRGKELLEHYYK